MVPHKAVCRNPEQAVERSEPVGAIDPFARQRRSRIDEREAGDFVMRGEEAVEAFVSGRNTTAQCGEGFSDHGDAKRGSHKKRDERRIEGTKTAAISAGMESQAKPAGARAAGSSSAAASTLPRYVAKVSHTAAGVADPRCRRQAREGVGGGATGRGLKCELS